MKKEYLILILVIAGLCGYLFTHNENRNNYTLPELKPLKASDITAITIEQNGKTIRISKTNEVWGITEKAYPADTDKINTLIKTITDLNITTLVSDKRDDARRYQLDSENRIKVTAEGSSGPVRTFEIGKVAPSYHQTFVILEGNDTIYHAAGNFRRDFEAGINELRNKQVLSFDEKTIKAMELNASGITRTLLPSPVTETDPAATPPPTETEKSASQDQAPATNNKAKTVWIFQDDNTPGDTDKVKTLLSTLSSLECDNYTADENKKSLGGQTPLCRILLKGDKEIELALFEKDANGKYPGLSSETPFPFVLDTYQGQDLVSNMETLLGIEKKPEDTETPLSTETQP
ncbi:DUF4340 domain-containing protein [Desulfocicer niacini]